MEQKPAVQGDEQLPKHAEENLVLRICQGFTSWVFFSFRFLSCFTRAEKGIKLVQEGQYAQAVALFTEAIRCDPEDYRYKNWKGD